ncbi:MAG TPA: folylpolyglutamate synthase/dihydrofolate synthase family protein [Opitutus sp.]|nr:folylpolyglutamate synthase/dihydrofolate synthase family protein [Opitutus sp.]
MRPDWTDVRAVAEYLFGLKPRGTKFGIDRMRLLAAKLGYPERALPVIHIAGTNGKGSVAAMLEAILREAGWKVGLYTSPHLVWVGERVQVDREALSASELAAYVAELDAIADEIATEVGEDDRPSFFEYMTAMAFLQFVRKRCDIAVVEVGLGGELDATNIVTPEVSVITSIALDHCEYLGETIEKIAVAKAGIIKNGRPLVVGRLPVEAEPVIRTHAAVKGAAVRSVREEFGEEVARYPRTRLAGEYQRWNAATAALVAQALGARWKISDEIITRGLQSVEWTGRWEQVTLAGRAIVLDASHNAEGAAVLEKNLEELEKKTGRKPVVIVGVLGGQRAQPLMETIARHAREIHLVVPNQSRATSYEELAAFVPRDYAGPILRRTVANVFPGGEICAAGGADDVVVVTGSIYLLGEVLSRIRIKS